MNSDLEVLLNDLSSYVPANPLQSPIVNLAVDGGTSFIAESVNTGDTFENLLDSGSYIPSEINDQADFDAYVKSLYDAALGDVSEAESSETSMAAIAYSEEQLQLLSDIAGNTNSLVNNVLVFSPSSTQAEYFRLIMLNNVWDDYYAAQTGDYEYYLYYGKNLEAGSSCHAVRIFRQQNGNYNYYWSVNKYETTCPTLDYGGYVYSNLDKSAAQLEGIKDVQTTQIISFSLCVLIGLFVVKRVLFR